MHASETKLQQIIEGEKQYVIPLFQRTYSWQEKEWRTLWNDLIELYEMETPRSHFLGSIVNMPAISVPEGIMKYLLIDGQQRLTTIIIILTLLRDKAKENNNQLLADEINENLLINKFKNGIEHYKLLPTQGDRNTYNELIKGNINNTHFNISADDRIKLAYNFFEKKLTQTPINLEKLKMIITSKLSIVSIVLDADDNPYLVFESLNAKGRPLTQADLIRNYFFMNINVTNQDEIYQKLWQPMQNALKDNLTEFIRHYLMREGSSIRQSDVYDELKDNVNQYNAIEYLTELNKYSKYYKKFIDPQTENDPEIKRRFDKLNRIEVTTAYPLLLNFYNDYSENRLTRHEFIEILDILENYIIRRYICHVPTNQLNKIFPSVYKSIQTSNNQDVVSEFKNILQSRGYPKDAEFYQRFKDNKFYGGAERNEKTKLILETIEASFGHKELPPFVNLTIEHIMPQNLTDWWKAHLGENWDETYELYLHTIGNLTLTAYNSELSNDDFYSKKRKLANSNLELNKYFNSIPEWNHEEIEKRADFLAKKALEIWKYFGNISTFENNENDRTGQIPFSLKMLGKSYEVKSWRDVLETTFNVISEINSEIFENIKKNFSRYISDQKNSLRETRQLKNGYYIEVNLSAQSIQKLCIQAIEIADLSSEDWKVLVR
ncbi:MAG TPA: DUF262 domain-containing protein [Bacteroidota bacterium]|nr:DUF262 domain-containing protein [Bacteroidota bacterium]HRT67533.1 DUF262 domain-containing protein [Bacteroidota bacterium]